MLDKLPKKWCIKSTKENALFIRTNISRIFNVTINGYMENAGWWYTNNKEADCSCHPSESKEYMINEGYTEITFEDFQRLVLNKTNELEYEIC